VRWLSALRRCRAVLVSIGLVLVAGGCATLDPLEDTRIESEVKAKLVAEKAANLTRIGVLSTNGDVYLSGTVVSADQKARAETVAKGVNGVRRVVNSLVVTPPR
jgi:hyperosmotically inducible periplasmic protein